MPRLHQTLLAVLALLPAAVGWSALPALARDAAPGLDDHREAAGDPAMLAILVRRGIDSRGARTGGWLRRAQATGKWLATVAELRDAHFPRCGAMP